jgi:hypothetical protein
MAEVVRLGASISTLTGTCAALGRILLIAANIVESAEYEARLIAAHIFTFACSLTKLTKVVKLPKITGMLITACTTFMEHSSVLIGDSLPHNTICRTFVIPLLRLRFRCGNRLRKLASPFAAKKSSWLYKSSSRSSAQNRWRLLPYHRCLLARI